MRPMQKHSTPHTFPAEAFDRHFVLEVLSSSGRHTGAVEVAVVVMAGLDGTGPDTPVAESYGGM